jgi:hypothetical protein
MLFLHALLFSLLGVSALAIPTPFTHAAASPLWAHRLAKEDPNRLNGVWREIKGVSEYRPFYLTRY